MSGTPEHPPARPTIPDPTSTFDPASRRGQLSYTNLDDAFEPSVHPHTPRPSPRRVWNADQGRWCDSVAPVPSDPSVALPDTLPTQAPSLSFDFPDELSGTLPRDTPVSDADRARRAPVGFVARLKSWLGITD